MQGSSFDPQQIHVLAEQSLSLVRLDAPGFILDIGGAGEGVIGRLNGRQVVAIDSSLSALEATGNDALKIRMQAEELQFAAQSFGAVTSFFTLMYIGRELRQRVFAEVQRVLMRGGWFYIWDLIISEENVDPSKPVLLIPLRLRLAGETIETGYGCLWQDKVQSPEEYVRIARKAGLRRVGVKREGNLFQMILEKPYGLP